MKLKKRIDTGRVYCVDFYFISLHKNCNFGTQQLKSPMMYGQSSQNTQRPYPVSKGRFNGRLAQWSSSEFITFIKQSIGILPVSKALYSWFSSTHFCKRMKDSLPCVHRAFCACVCGFSCPLIIFWIQSLSPQISSSFVLVPNKRVLLHFTGSVVKVVLSLYYCLSWKLWASRFWVGLQLRHRH